MTRMTHPEHGFHIAYNLAEVDAMKKTGWSPITEADFRKLVAAKSEEAGEVVEPAKRGRPRAVAA